MTPVIARSGRTGSLLLLILADSVPARWRPRFAALWSTLARGGLGVRFADDDGAQYGTPMSLHPGRGVPRSADPGPAIPPRNAQ